MPDSIPEHDGHLSAMADSIPLIRQIVRHLIGTVSVMLPDGCPPSRRNPVRHRPAHAAILPSLWLSRREYLQTTDERADFGVLTNGKTILSSVKYPAMLSSDRCIRALSLRSVKFLSQLLTALNLLPSMATIASEKSFRLRHKTMNSRQTLRIA
jgi:hypothetical protein